MWGASITFRDGSRGPQDARGRKRPMSYRFTRTKILGLVIAAGLVASACGGTPAASTAPSAAGSAAASAAPGTLPKPEQTSIKIGISAPTEPVQYAEELANQLGYYKELGFTNVTVTGF